VMNKLLQHIPAAVPLRAPQQTLANCTHQRSLMNDHISICQPTTTDAVLQDCPHPRGQNVLAIASRSCSLRLDLLKTWPGPRMLWLQVHKKIVTADLCCQSYCLLLLSSLYFYKCVN